jgi:hypothetical protein
MAAVDAAVQLETGFLDMRLVEVVQRFDLKEPLPMLSLQVVAVVLGLLQTR